MIKTIFKQYNEYIVKVFTKKKQTSHLKIFFFFKNVQNFFDVCLRKLKFIL